MIIDWFQFWLIFSGILLFFGFLSLIVKFSDWVKFRRELAVMKKGDVKDLLGDGQHHHFVNDKELSEVLEIRKEIDLLMKDVCFDVYDRNATVGKGSPLQDNSFDFQEQIESLLDGKIMGILKEKDNIISQKDSLIALLDEKNEKLTKNIVQKLFFLVVEKDKLIKEKNGMIELLQHKLYILPDEAVLQPKPQQPIQAQKKPVDHTGFINVNHV